MCYCFAMLAVYLLTGASGMGNLLPCSTPPRGKRWSLPPRPSQSALRERSTVRLTANARGPERDLPRSKRYGTPQSWQQSGSDQLWRDCRPVQLQHAGSVQHRRQGLVSHRQALERDRGMDAWLDERIMCGWPYPITRRQALDEMVADGWQANKAVAALCWYKEIRDE